MCDKVFNTSNNTVLLRLNRSLEKVNFLFGRHLFKKRSFAILIRIKMTSAKESLKREFFLKEFPILIQH